MAKLNIRKADAESLLSEIKSDELHKEKKILNRNLATYVEKSEAFRARTKKMEQFSHIYAFR